MAFEEEVLGAVESDAFDPAGGGGAEFGAEEAGQVPGLTATAAAIVGRL